MTKPLLSCLVITRKLIRLHNNYCMSYRLTIREMTLEDVPKLKLDEEWMYERYEYHLSNKTGPALIAEEDGQALCAFGALFEWGQSGACEVWFNLIARRRTFNVVRILKRLIVELAARHKVTRMQAIVKCDSAVNNRFMRFMGFVNETPGGMKNKLYNGNDAFMYSRVF